MVCPISFSSRVPLLDKKILSRNTTFQSLYRKICTSVCRQLQHVWGFYGRSGVRSTAWPAGSFVESSLCCSPILRWSEKPWSLVFQTIKHERSSRGFLIDCTLFQRATWSFFVSLKVASDLPSAKSGAISSSWTEPLLSVTCSVHHVAEQFAELVWQASIGHILTVSTVASRKPVARWLACVVTIHIHQRNSRPLQSSAADFYKPGEFLISNIISLLFPFPWVTITHSRDTKTVVGSAEDLGETDAGIHLYLGISVENYKWSIVRNRSKMVISRPSRQSGTGCVLWMGMAL